MRVYKGVTGYCLLDLVRQELEEEMDLTAQPVVTRIYRWPGPPIRRGPPGARGPTRSHGGRPARPVSHRQRLSRRRPPRLHPAGYVQHNKPKSRSFKLTGQNSQVDSD